MRQVTLRPGLVTWTAATVATLVCVGGAFAPTVRFGGPAVLFWTVSIAATLCAIGAGLVLALGFRRSNGEVALAGSALWAASILPLVHGITAPGILYGENSTVIVSAFLALPVALLSGLPLIAPTWGPSRWLARRWRVWTSVGVAGSTLMVAYLLAAPNSIPAPAMGRPFAITVSALCLVSFLAMSWRQLTLYWVGRRRSSFVASLAYLMLGSSAMVWWQTSSFTIGWWLVHLVDVCGVLAGCVGVARSSKIPSAVERVLVPIVSRDPLASLEFGLAPVVHRFVGDLEAKDSTTRDHVVRTAESALRVGQAMGLPMSRLRHLGLAALLHDIGKLEIPSELLNKPGKLDDAEFAVMQRHAAIGGEMIGAVPLLAPAAKFVRGHHERIDGRGYPDRLTDDEIPLEARIISVCDAFDAMANTRQYRTGMGVDRAIAILREHAGSQWDRRVVDAALKVLPELHDAPAALDQVGRSTNHEVESTTPVPSPCPDALPPSAVLQLAAQSAPPTSETTASTV